MNCHNIPKNQELITQLAPWSRLGHMKHVNLPNILFSKPSKKCMEEWGDNENRLWRPLTFCTLNLRQSRECVDIIWAVTHQQQSRRGAGLGTGAETRQFRLVWRTICNTCRGVLRVRGARRHMATHCLLNLIIFEQILVFLLEVI